VVVVNELLKVGAHRFTEFYETSTYVSTTTNRDWNGASMSRQCCPLDEAAE
jgi:hypothetical protein